MTDEFEELVSRIEKAEKRKWLLDAARFHLSESQLRRRFVAAYGIPPIAYRNRLRCKIAMELLCRSELGVAQIAQQVGFEDPTDFYRRFRAETGLSPSDFRKKHSITKDC